MNEDELRTGMILGESAGLAKFAMTEIILLVVVLAGLGTASDLLGWERGGLLSYNIASLALGYAVTLTMIRKGGLGHDTSRGFGAYFGIGILSGLGIVAGLVVLIIPGIFLAVRWSAAYGYALGDGAGVTASMGRSWEDTKPHFLAILGALAMPLVVFVPVFILAVATADETGATPDWVTIVLNVATAGYSAANTVLGVGIYSLVRSTRQRHAEVFA